MNSIGKASNSFVVLDLMRLPLGILSGIGFIGAGAILRKDGLVRGVTTAATMWYVTVLGLLFGGGQLKLGTASTILALFILWPLKLVENHIPTHRTGSLSMQFAEPKPGKNTALPTELELRQRFQRAGYSIQEWTVHYRDSALCSLECDLRWSQVGHEHPSTPQLMRELAALPCVSSLCWRG